MKKIFLMFIVLSIMVFYGLETKQRKNIENNISNLLAIYQNDEKIDKIPTKESNVLFDEEQSTCDNDAKITWNYDIWGPVISNLKLTKTKCFLHFRDYYKIKVNENTIRVPITKGTTEISSNGKILLCNNGINLKETNGQILLSNITKDATCNFYESTTDAINNLDNTDNFLLFLTNEEVENALTIGEDKNLTIDLNGYTKSGRIENLGNIKIFSSKTEKGTWKTNTTISPVIVGHNNSTLQVENLKIESPYSCLAIYEKSKGKFINTECTGNTGSAIFTKKETTLEVISSKLEALYGIGGEGGEIIVDNSHIIGTERAGIQINTNCTGNIMIKNSSKVDGPKGIGIAFMGSGTLTLDGTDSSYPIITGGTVDSGRAISIDTKETTFYFNYGETFGHMINTIQGTLVVRDGKTLKTETKDGQVHTYLE